ncbi:MAG: aldehyde ferredoxin oxidoreductase family protein [Thermomicrobiales bacterium]
MAIYGSHGRLLHIDISSGTATPHSIPDLVYARLIGGIGLASYLLDRWCPPGADPLGPENPLIFATSPFVGTGITTASKIAVAAKSPQTGVIGDSLSSSYLALALKRTGFDALVLTGHAPSWSLLVVEDDAVTIRAADHLLGMDPVETADAVRAELGSGFRVAAIGVAGERGVKYAAISNDGRLAGRTGAGAVMGSKRIKAIAVRGAGLPAVCDPKGLAVAARRLAEKSLGPGTAKYRELGTAANLAFFNRMGVLPTRNFQSGSFDEAEAISGETLFLEHRTDRNACAACTIGCEHHYRTRDGGPETHARMEYETLFALGSLCGVGDPNTVLRAAARCDELGIDAISTGATVAWAMECAERGVDLGYPTDQIPRFGDGAELLRTITAIGRREGIGDLLAEGSRRAAEIVGQGSDAWAMHVKGLEMPGYDPRKLQTLALGLAVGTRGACHNRSSAYEVDFSDRLDADAAATARAEAAAAAEDQAAVLDSLTICKFLRHAFDDLYGEAAELHAHVTGLPTTGDDLRRAGERITTIKKQFNIRQGWTRADDTLPPRVLDGDGLLNHDWLNRMVDAYYRVRGWDADGAIPADHLTRIGLADLVEFDRAHTVSFAGESSVEQRRSP